MKILVINPPRYNGIPVIREDRCEITERNSILPCYSLMQLSTILKRENDVDYIDANGFNIGIDELKSRLKKERYDKIIVRFTPETIDNDLKICEYAKKIDPKTITEGICYTLRGYHEEIQKKYYLNELKTLQDYFTGFPEPDYSTIPYLPYQARGCKKPFTITYSSRGCPYLCQFCTSAGKKYEVRDSDEIIEELIFLKKKYNLKSFMFYDETFTINKKRVIDLCKKLKKLKLEWFCNTRTNLVDEELLRIMKEAGCRGISFGIESGDDKILSYINKNSCKYNHSAIGLCRKLGIKTHCSFLIGLPWETRKTIRKTIEFVKKTLPNSCQFNIFVPYPNTILHEELSLGRINIKKLRQDYSFKSYCKLSPKELVYWRRKAYFSIYFNPKWIFSNILFIAKNPSDIFPAARYYLNSIKNYFRGLKNAH